MDYRQTLDYMYARLPMFQRIGKTAFKKDLANTVKFLDAIGNPHLDFKAVHIAGTNGKGTSAHSIASVLQQAGYNTGLYTSPHLKNFTERIRLNGQEVPQDFVVEFVDSYQSIIEEIQPSFFETTVVMAFHYFSSVKVDVAVVEVGMGGRLDSTNVLDPIISLITTIGYDHQEFLGETLEEIATEKAGIIKSNRPVVIGDTHENLRAVFDEVANSKDAGIGYAADHWQIETDREMVTAVSDSCNYRFKPDIAGIYYLKNLPGILQTLSSLRGLGFNITDQALISGLQTVKQSTGLKGRWQVLSRKPLTICDVGHNTDGIMENLKQIKALSYNQLYFIIGGVSDKRWDDILELLPRDGHYIICTPSIPRAISVTALAGFFEKHKLTYTVEADVNIALAVARKLATAEDLIFVGGSTFVVAELNEL